MARISREPLLEQHGFFSYKMAQSQKEKRSKAKQASTAKVLMPRQIIRES
jgi:hypothetical protein